MGISQFDERQPAVIGNTYVLADGTTWKAILASTTNGGRVDDLLASNNGAASRVVEVRVNNSGTFYLVGSVTVPAGSGYAGVAPVDMMAALLPVRQAGIVIGGFVILEGRVTLAMGVAEQVDVTGFGGSF